MNEEEKQQEILSAYRQMIENTREALRLSGMPEKLIIVETINLPQFDKMIPEDIVKFYKEVQYFTILSLHKLGFTQREIAKRLGGGSLNTVWHILKLQKNMGAKSEKATIEEVMEA